MKVTYKHDCDFFGNNILCLQIELPECRRSILLDHKRYFLSIPSIYFSLIIDNYGDIKSAVGYKIDDDVYLCNLPNVMGNYICLNNISLYKLFKTNKLNINNLDKDLFACEFVNYFWNSVFTYDLCYNIFSYKGYLKQNFNKDNIVNDYIIDWHNKTKSQNKCFDKNNLKKISSVKKFNEIIFLDYFGS